MAARNKPYDQFGPFILFKKLDADALGESWRAGKIAGASLGPTVAVRRLTGGNREALAQAAAAAHPIVAQLSGTSFAKEQEVGAIDGVAYVAHDYAGGRSLRHIIDRARGANGGTPNPLPIDQAIVIAEKVALSLTTMNDLRDSGGNRLVHGALIPQFVWISDDGEIRVGGQMLGPGLVASLADPKVAADIGRYFSSEYRATGTPSKGSEVFAMGAIVFLLVTGQEPPDSSTASAFMSVVRAAKTMAGNPIPDDIRIILDKSFNLDPSMRYASIADMKQAISALAHGGKYSASTFNLAFYLSNLLKKEMEGEAVERDKESKVNIAPYLEATSRPAPTAPAAAVPVFAGLEEEPKRKSKAPLIAVAALVIAGVAIGGFVMMQNKSAAPGPASATTQAATIPAPAAAKPPLVAEPMVAVSDSSTTNIPVGSDPEAQKKAFEDAVKARMQAEMMKLQDEFTKQLKQQPSKNAPMPSTPAAATASQPAEERSVSAAALDQQRREAATETAQPQTASVAPQVVPAPVTTQTQAPAPQPAAPAPQVAAVREGDVIDLAQLDVMPKVIRASKPQYPPIAARQRVAGEVYVTALISERGDVVEVKVLRGLGSRGYGIDEAAVRAMRNFKFSPGMKGGVRVRTWWPQPMVFKPE